MGSLVFYSNRVTPSDWLTTTTAKKSLRRLNAATGVQVVVLDALRPMEHPST